MVRKRRLELIDFLRGSALLAMAIYHFAWDLEFFGYSLPGTTAHGGWKFFARVIATSFLFLVGISLYLAHGRSLKALSFFKRFSMVAAAAALISVATWFFVPEAFIFFGILHQIALASLLGLIFLRLPSFLIITAAFFVISAPAFLRSPMFDHPAMWWVGLSIQNPVSNDYVPIFPWFGIVLLGIGFAKWSDTKNLIDQYASISLPNWTKPFQYAGQHSLAVYLIHQPILIGSLWIFSQIIPATSHTAESIFSQSCIVQCEETHATKFCQTYCGCVIDGLKQEKIFDNVYAGMQTPDDMISLNEIVAQCTFDARQQQSILKDEQ